MKRIVCCLILLLFLVTGCGYKSVIFFNDEPFSKDNFKQVKTGFRTGEKIYYLFITPNKMKSPYIRVQISEVKDKTYTNFYKVFHSQDRRLMQDEIYYQTDYFVIHTRGRYLMQVFARNDLAKPLAFAFFVVN